MPRIVPSEVVAVIDKLFPGLIAQEDSPSKEITLDSSHLYQVSAIASLSDQIPQELITLGPDDYAKYAASIAAIKTSVETWTARGNTSIGNLESISGLSHLNPITIIRRSLEKCPDEFPTDFVPEMLFITDESLRESIRIDIGTAEQAFRNAEWKASTILAGAAIEALLLWRLLPEDISSLRTQEAFAKAPKKIEDWGLALLLKASKAMGIIKDDTYTQADLAKDFRNLIHPGKSLRLQRKCTKATALTALASLEQVIENITP
jgi:hypothetical protein